MSTAKMIRNGYEVSPERASVWEVELKMLRKLLDVCQKYNLDIWVDGGTLLGTVRHQGFIPWDDDIDMVMLRDDYDKLVSVAPQEFTHPFFFQCGYTENYYPRGHAQLRMDGTTAILADASEIFPGTHQGIFLDIFPYDAVPDDPVKRQDLIDRRNRLTEMMRRVAYFDMLHPVHSIRLLRYRVGFGKLYGEFEDIFRENKIADNRYVSCLSYRVDFNRLLRDRQWYGETLFLPFEGISVPVPAGFKDILRLQYGDDYMTPKEVSSDHGRYLVLDAEKSWEEYGPKIRNYCRKDRLDHYKRRVKKLLWKQH